MRLILILVMAILTLASCAQERDRPLTDEEAEQIVDALMENPRYQEYLEDDEWVTQFVDEMVRHPLYQTTPREDCAQIILMAAVISGEYTMPPATEVERLCAWYLDNAQ